MSLLGMLRHFGNSGAVANAAGEISLVRHRDQQVDAAVGRVEAAMAAASVPASTAGTASTAAAA